MIIEPAAGTMLGAPAIFIIVQLCKGKLREWIPNTPNWGIPLFVVVLSLFLSYLFIEAPVLIQTRQGIVIALVALGLHGIKKASGK